MQKFAMAVGRMLAPFRRVLADFPRLLDAWRTDPAWLAWLSQVSGAPDLTQWDEAAQRAAIECAPSLAVSRGTLTALLQEASLLGWEVSVADPGWAQPAKDMPADLRRFPLAVAIAWPPESSLDLPSVRDRLTRLARDNSPASLPVTVLVGEGNSPTAALTLPAASHAVSGDARTVFFYGPTAPADQTVGYNLASRHPVPGPSPLAERWEGLNNRGEGKFAQGSIDAAVYSPEANGFFLFSGQQAARWDEKSASFTSIESTRDLFPGLGTSHISGVLYAAQPGGNKVLHVFSGTSCYRYKHFGEQGGENNRIEIQQLYSPNLPEQYVHDLTAVVDDPYQENVHYLISGPMCAEIDGFTFKASHLIRDLWPGLPIHTSSHERGGGSLSTTEFIVFGEDVRVSYYTRSPWKDGTVYLHTGPGVTVENVHTLKNFLAEIKASGVSGDIIIPHATIKTPGIHALYYGSPSFDSWSSNPHEFTVILPESLLSNCQFEVYSNPATCGTAIECGWLIPEDEWREGASVAFYRQSENSRLFEQNNRVVASTPPASEPTLLPSVHEFSDNSGTLTIPNPSLPPGLYAAFLLACGGRATLTYGAPLVIDLPPHGRGTLKLRGRDAASVPPDETVTFDLTPGQADNYPWPDGMLCIFAGQDPYTPDRNPVSRESIGKDQRQYTTQSFLPGGYTARWSPKDEFLLLADQLDFTVTTNSAWYGKLEAQPSSGTDINLNYSTTYIPTSANIISIFEKTSDAQAGPQINTRKESWGSSAIHVVGTATPSGSVTIRAGDFSEASPWAPGDYIIHFTGSGGGGLAEPIPFCATLPSLPEALTIDPSENITDQITATYRTDYSSPRDMLEIYEGAYDGASLQKPDGAPFLQHPAQQGRDIIALSDLTPGRYTLYYTARGSRALLAQPKTFLRNTSTGETGSIEIPGGKTYTLGDHIVIGYKTQFSDKDSKVKENRIRAVQNNREIAYQEAHDDSGKVDLGALPAGSYQIEFTGKDGSTLAPPLPLTVHARTIALTFRADKNDNWNLTKQTLKDCTSSVPLSEHPTVTNQKAQVITYTQESSKTVAMSGTLTFTSTDRRAVNVTWAMADGGEVSYTATGPKGIQVTLAPSTLLSTTAQTVTPVPSPNGPYAQATVSLTDTQHPPIVETWQNHLPFALTLAQNQPVSDNSTIKITPAPTIDAGGTSSIEFTTTISSLPSQGSVTYTFIPQGKTDPQHITLLWKKTPNNPPTYTFTIPPGAEIKADTEKWKHIE